MIYPYVAQFADGILRPILPVMLHGPEHSRQFDMLVDSGADVSGMSRHAAELIGLQLEAGRQQSYDLPDGHVTTGVVVDVQATIMGRDIRFPVAVIEIETETMAPLLGQQGFFDQFEVQFRRFRNEFEIVPVQK